MTIFENNRQLQRFRSPQIIVIIGSIILFISLYRYEIQEKLFKQKDDLMNIMDSIRRSRRLVTFNPVVDKPVINWISNRTVHAALLHTCEFTKTHLANYFRYQHFCENITAEYTTKVLTSIPLSFMYWPTIVAKVCPTILSHSSHHKAEKGYGMSHLQIWMEFVFYDLDILEARLRKPPEYITSNSFSSVSGIFQSFENGTLLKNNYQFQDDDLIIVIEEDSIPHLNITDDNLFHFQRELSQLSDSILNLRPCSIELLSHNEHSGGTNITSALRRRLTSSHGESVSPPIHHVSHHHTHGYNVGHSCFSAYAMTRKVARHLSENFDLCGKFLDHQIMQIMKHSNFSILHSESHLFT